jgi:hypothetical protein
MTIINTTSQSEFEIATATGTPTGKTVTGVQLMALDVNGSPQALGIANPVPTSSAPGPATVISGQLGIGTNGTAVNFPSGTITQGGFIRANIGNVGVGFIGNAGVTNAVYPTAGGGYRLNPGDAISVIAGTNLNNNWVNGTAGDSFDYYVN